MNNVLPCMTFIFVDRRQTGRGKSLNNRQKLLKRIKESIKSSKPSDIDTGGIRISGQPHGTQSFTNPIKVTRAALSEPTFHYDTQSGEYDVVLFGNDHWLKGDRFPVRSHNEDEDGIGEGEVGQGDDGEDDFIINISRTEFFDVFFEDCELPNLLETNEKDAPEAVWQRAGFQKIGTPGQLSIIRSFKLSKARRLALTINSREELKKLEEYLNKLMAEDYELSPENGIDTWIQEVQSITLQISELKTKINSVITFENLDLRFRRYDKIQVKTTDAVFCMLMDVSGSMDEGKKLMARKFFSLQYAFIKRKYPQTDLIFIAHTSDAEELTEEEFFSTRLSGGTVVSPAWILAHKIIRERYDPSLTNIYLSYAGDGDNWVNDNENVKKEIIDLLHKLRHAVYVQVGRNFAVSFAGATLWNTIENIASEYKKLALIQIDDENEVFDAFKTIYAKG